MEAVYGFARQVQPPVPLSAEHRKSADGPLLLNLLPSADQPYLSSPDLQRLSSTLQVELWDCLSNFGPPGFALSRPVPIVLSINTFALGGLRFLTPAQ